MKNYNNISKMLLVAIALVALSFNSTAQSCNSTLASRTGTVMAAGPAKIEFTATSNSVNVDINKTGGKAKTTVNIYANGSFKDRMIFENGRDTPRMNKTISGVNGKTIKVEIVNQSVGNKFQYRMNATGSTTNLSKSGTETGSMIGQQKKTIYTNASCTGKTKITIKRTSGNARGTVRVWKKVGTSWTEHSSDTFEVSQPNDQMVINVNSGQELKIELKNISVGNIFKYSMEAEVN